MHASCFYNCMYCMYSSDVEWYRRESGTRPTDGHASARLGPIADDCQSIRSFLTLSLHWMSTPWSSSNATSSTRPPFAASSSCYKKSNRKLNCYSMLMISTHKYIQKYIQTCINACIYRYIHTYYIHAYIRFIRYQTFIHTSCSMREK